MNKQAAVTIRQLLQRMQVKGISLPDANEGENSVNDSVLWSLFTSLKRVKDEVVVSNNQLKKIIGVFTGDSVANYDNKPLSEE